MIAEHPNGNLFLSGYRNASKSPQLWRSTDKGKSWNSLDVGGIAEGAVGNSDVDLLIDEQGTIYLLTMKYTRFPTDITNFDFSSMKGEHIAIGISHDAGETWQWQYLSRKHYDDRPWIEITSDGTVHVIWNNGRGVHYMTSADQGRTWQLQDQVYPQGGSSYLASGPNGRLAARITPMSASGLQFDEGVDLIRLSTDNGQTWSDVSLPGNREWASELGEGIPRWVEPLDWDSKGQLYYLWSEGNELKLGIAVMGQHWQVRTVATGDTTLYYPYLRVNDDYAVCSWISGFGESLRHHAAAIELMDTNVSVFKSTPLKLNIYSRTDESDHLLETGGEYFPIIPLSDGDFGMATPIQNRKDNQFGFTWWRLAVE